MVDVDLDGDVDILFAEDQGAYPEANETFPFPPFEPGTDRGLLHIFKNDGKGHFDDHPVLDTPFVTGAYMGFSFGDFNCDGHLDFFATNFGDYAIALGDPNPPVLGFQASRWFLGNGDGSVIGPTNSWWATIAARSSGKEAQSPQKSARRMTATRHTWLAASNSVTNTALSATVSVKVNSSSNWSTTRMSGASRKAAVTRRRATPADPHANHRSVATALLYVGRPEPDQPVDTRLPPASHHLSVFGWLFPEHSW